jgi:hypothetical protein
LEHLMQPSLTSPLPPLSSLLFLRHLRLHIRVSASQNMALRQINREH